ncbi:MAG: Glu/Leu/Phe/Val dehydrogenase [bacterium]|nr:Glu/Leu/Phe/Val dehydrogenase [bacterium]MCP5065424.1 Glu/Leu/Phe/Val dehydrogenase [bacterium]
MRYFESPQFSDHEQVAFCNDPVSGLRAIIAIHDRTLGPAVGGCRIWDYVSEEDAIEDVLRLSRGMSYKSALAGLPFGGGKAVIRANPHRDKTEELLRAFGRFVDAQQGRYITAEDVGMTVEDIETVARETRYVAGRSEGEGASGDPSPMTAYGVFTGIRAAVTHRLGKGALDGVRVAVQGLGNVGGNLCRYLRAAGASLVVSDVREALVQEAVAAYGADPTEPDAIHQQQVDVFAPCALGGILNDQTIPEIRAPIVAGAANNQLAEDRHGSELANRGILYAPDYAINAGGVINITEEGKAHYDRDRALARVGEIRGRLLTIFARSDAEGLPTSLIADEMAREVIFAARSGGRILNGSMGRGSQTEKAPGLHLPGTVVQKKSGT